MSAGTPGGQPEGDASVEPGADRRRIVVTASLLALVSVLAVPYIVSASLPDLELGLPFESAVTGPMSATARQRWVFFSDDPRAPVITPFARRGGDWVQVEQSTVDALPRSLGFGRWERTLLREAEGLARQAEERGGRFTVCAEGPAVCVEGMTSWVVANHGALPRLCGEVVLVREGVAHEQLPGAPSGADPSFPQLLRLLVQC